MIPFIIAMLFFILFLFFGISVYYLHKDKEIRRKEKTLKGLIPEVFENNRGSVIIAEKTEGHVERFFGRFLDLASLESMLIAANVPLSIDRLLTFSLGTGIIFILPVVFIFRSPYLILPLLLLGMALPILYVLYRKKKKEDNLIEQLPDALDMIVRALRVGQSVDGALQEVARSFSPPIGTEIKNIYDEMSLGLPFEKAFRNFEKRFHKIAEVKILVTAFIIQRETGGNLSTVLEGVARTIRERFLLKRKIDVLTAEGRLSALILGLLPLFFLVVAWFFNPKYVSLFFNNSAGKKLFFAAILFETAGFVTMRLISRIKV